MAVVPQGHVAVDFVGDDQYAAFVAEGGQPAQRLRVPDDAARVVRVGEQQQAASVVRHARQLVEVHRVAPAGVLAQRVEDDLPAVSLGNEPEGVVDGRLDDDLLVLPDEAVDDQSDALDDSRDVGDPFAAHLPSVVRADPVGDRGAVVGGFRRVAVERVLQPPAERADDEVGRLEIHVGDPHRQQVAAAEVLRERVVFHRIRAAPVDGAVEVAGPGGRGVAGMSGGSVSFFHVRNPVWVVAGAGRHSSSGRAA